jgi:hypothetical protein
MQRSGSASSQAGEMDGADLRGSISKAVRACDRQDASSLRKGSKSPRAGCPTPAKPPVDTSSLGTTTARTDSILSRSRLAWTISVVALASLIGLTSWAIASVSNGLVAAYAFVMVLIFALPRAQNPDEENRPAEDSRSRDQATRPRRFQGAVTVRADRRDCATLIERNPAERPADRTSPSSSVGKAIGRARSRVRKAGKLDSDPIPELPRGSWLQIAPGKFVRADAQDPRIGAALQPHGPIEDEESAVNETEPCRNEQDGVIAIAPSGDFDGNQVDPGLDRIDETSHSRAPLTDPVPSVDQIAGGCHQGPGLMLGEPEAELPQNCAASDGTPLSGREHTQCSERIRAGIRHTRRRALRVPPSSDPSPAFRNVWFGSKVRGSVASIQNVRSCRRSLHSRAFRRFSRTRGNPWPRSPPLRF